jgi:hypothetical protein
MNALNCFGEKLSAFVIGMVLLSLGIVFIIIGLTVLPVIGLVVAVPLLIASAPFLKSAFVSACRYYGL